MPDSQQLLKDLDKKLCAAADSWRLANRVKSTGMSVRSAVAGARIHQRKKGLRLLVVNPYAVIS